MSLCRSAPRLAAIAAALGTAACSGPPPAPAKADQVGSIGAPAGAAAPDQTPSVAVPAGNATMAATPVKSAAAYAGRWIGPEGLLLEVTPRADRGVTVVNQWTLDDRGEFIGEVTAAGLRFARGSETVTAVMSDGDATGMKWLAGKRDCLTVKVGSEGYCRP